jgi:hypothetical protein
MNARVSSRTTLGVLVWEVDNNVMLGQACGEQVVTLVMSGEQSARLAEKASRDTTAGRAGEQDGVQTARLTEEQGGRHDSGAGATPKKANSTDTRCG